MLTTPIDRRESPTVRRMLGVATIALFALIAAIVPAMAHGATPAQLTLSGVDPEFGAVTINRTNGLPTTGSPGRFSLGITPDGGTPFTTTGYCVDVNTSITTGIPYPVELVSSEEDPQLVGSNSGPIAWLLANADSLITSSQEPSVTAGAIQVVLWQLLGQVPLDNPTGDQDLNAAAAVIYPQTQGKAVAGPLTAATQGASGCAGSSVPVTFTGTPGTVASVALTQGVGSVSVDTVTFDEQGSATVQVTSATPGDVIITATAEGGVVTLAKRPAEATGPQETGFFVPRTFTATASVRFDDCPPALETGGAQTPVVTPVTPTTPVIAKCPRPNLAVSVRGPRSVTAGRRVTYRIRIVNRSRTNRSRAGRLTISIPGGLAVASTPKWLRVRSGAIRGTLSPLGTRSARTVRVTFRVVGSAQGARRITARVTAPCGAAATGRKRLAVRALPQRVQPAVTG